MSAFICYLYLLFHQNSNSARGVKQFQMCIFEMCICVYVMSRISLKRDVQFVLHVEHVCLACYHLFIVSMFFDSFGVCSKKSGAHREHLAETD